MGDEVTNGVWVRPKNHTNVNTTNKDVGSSRSTIYNFNDKDWPTPGEAVNCVDMTSNTHGSHSGQGSNSKNTSGKANHNNWDIINVNKKLSQSSRENNEESNGYNSGKPRKDASYSISTVNITKNMSEIVISEETETFSKLKITKEPNCNNQSESESICSSTNTLSASSDSVSRTTVGGKKGQENSELGNGDSNRSSNITKNNNSNNINNTSSCKGNNSSNSSNSNNNSIDANSSCSNKGKISNSDQDDESAKQNADGISSGNEQPSEQLNDNSKGEESSSSTQTTTSTSAIANSATLGKSSKKKGSKNRWRPLEIEPPASKSEERRRGQRLSRNPRKEAVIVNNNSSSELPNGGMTNSKKYGDNLQQHAPISRSSVAPPPPPPEKSFRGGRRVRGRGRGSGGGSLSMSSSTGVGGGGSGGGPGMGPPHRSGGGRVSRGYDSGRVTPSQGLHEDFPADIAYYVDYSPISDATISTEAEIDSGIISPTLGPPPTAVAAAAFVTPAIVPTTTTFVPTAAFFTPYAAAVSAATLDPIALKKSIKMQIEYYFSEENLQRDFFLRRKMDEEGYLPISLIASFHRVKALTNEVGMVIDSLRGSDKVEFSEDGSKLRTTLNPLKWPIFDQRPPQLDSREK